MKRQLNKQHLNILIVIFVGFGLTIFFGWVLDTIPSIPMASWDLPPFLNYIIGGLMVDVIISIFLGFIYLIILLLKKIYDWLFEPLKDN